MNETYQSIIRFMQEFYNRCSESNGLEKIDLTKSLGSTLSDIGLDSMNAIELIILAEERFSISIAGPDLPQVSTVENYASMIHSKLGGDSND